MNDEKSRTSRAKTVAAATRMDGVLLLISGASGAGKTSVRNAITPDLARR